MDESRIILKVRVGGYEVQFEGSRENVLRMLEEDLPKIVESLSKVKPETVQPSTEVVSSEKPLLEAQMEESYPSIQAKSCAEAILALLSTPWGRKKPRSLSEIKAALEVNALHYSGKVIGFTLTRLTKRQKVRRWKTEAGYVYTIASPQPQTV
ncbi:MAG: hypothetical protein DRO36_00935 [Candidatus Hecatellales archaeon]|nr:MAG: hypothetical protein DRO36_00935 [Candidatus Hecatellales archaeon]